SGWPGKMRRQGERKQPTLGFTGGVPEQNRAQLIVRGVSEHALHATAGLMLKAFLPQPVAVADGAELLDIEISQHSYAAEFVRTGAMRVRIKHAVGNGCESGVLRHLERVLVVASSRTREVFDWVSDNAFDL